MPWRLNRKVHQLSMILGCASMTSLVCAQSSPYQTGAPQPASAEACAAIVTNATRLECYDALFRLSQATTPAVISEQRAAAEIAPEAERFSDRVLQKTSNIFATEGTKLSPNHSLLDSRWELAVESKLGTWNVRAYQPVYLMPVFWTSKKNETPFSENPENSVGPEDEKRLNSTEAKFQLSLKTKAIENIIGDNGDLWLGYTQSSRWQVYNGEESRPFRETNYEPEVSLVFRTNYDILGLNWRMMAMTLNHQSNGRSDPWSRSWNRVMLNLGFDKGNFAMMVRPWYRISEDSSEDNNPHIEDYIGRGDVTAFYRWNGHDFNLMLRHSLKGGDDNRGAAKLDWTFPISGNLRGHMNVFTGFGESVIDYNHRATYLGLGVSLIDWY